MSTREATKEYFNTTTTLKLMVLIQTFHIENSNPEDSGEYSSGITVMGVPCHWKRQYKCDPLTLAYSILSVQQPE
jgi:hypothetical protein